MAFSVKEAEVAELDTLTDLDPPKDLIVFNDDVNTFDHVITTLVKVCRHTPEQAEQCAWIIHYRQKCTVKKGSFDELRPMRDAICERGIDARII